MHTNTHALAEIQIRDFILRLALDLRAEEIDKNLWYHSERRGDNLEKRKM
jgi:hypothetical protein